MEILIVLAIAAGAITQVNPNRPTGFLARMSMAGWAYLAAVGAHEQAKAGRRCP